MKISEVMTKNPVSVQTTTGIEEIARHMVTCDCGSVPVTENGRVVGIVTDRDIVTRSIAAGKCPLQLIAKDLMSHPVVVVSCDDELTEVIKTFEANQVKRLPVVDTANRVVGIVSQADLSRAASQTQLGLLVQSISQSIDIGHS